MAITNRTDGPTDGGMVVGQAVKDLNIFPPEDPLAGGSAIDLSRPIPVYTLKMDLSIDDEQAPIEAEQTKWRYLLVRGSSDVSYADVFREHGTTRFASISRNANADKLLEGARLAEDLAAALKGNCEFRIIEAPSSRMSAVWLHCNQPYFVPYIDGTVRKDALLLVLSWPEFRGELRRRLQPVSDPKDRLDHLR